MKPKLDVNGWAEFDRFYHLVFERTESQLNQIDNFDMTINVSYNECENFNREKLLELYDTQLLLIKGVEIETYRVA